MTTTHDELRELIFRRLAETAENIRKGGALSDREVTTAFMAVGMTLAQHTCGPIGAAAWLRGMAEEIECGETGLVN